MTTLGKASIRLILALGVVWALGAVWTLGVARAAGAEPPADLARRVAEREAQARAARDHYAYRQVVRIQEFPSRGGRGGEYRETREVIFSPKGERTERMVGQPVMNLNRLRLTDEDFRDIRDVQPFLFTTDELWLYEVAFRGDENIDGFDCWVLKVRPRQLLEGMRLFDGMMWVAKRDYAVIRTVGVAVPQILRKTEENLFPHFTTHRVEVDGQWFPAVTYADDTLEFSSGPIRIRMTIEYQKYQRFTASSSIQFEPVSPK